MLYLVHHAEAADAEIDAQRPLTANGRLHAEQLAARAAKRGVRPAVVWHSGKLRARQTAEYFWRTCNPLGELSAARNLQPDDPPQWAADAVAGETRDIVLVGHMPHIARLHELLAGSALVAAFPVHGMVALREENGRWVEAWRDDG